MLCEDNHAALLAAGVDAPLAYLFADWERAAGSGEPLLPVPCVHSCGAGAGVCLPLLRRINSLSIHHDAARRVGDSIDRMISALQLNSLFSVPWWK